ncbi:MAG TPA: lysylphosphatidylglycerol synthase transmembrane domain-containing protein [Candidatus Nanopelagicales bacterium]
MTKPPDPGTTEVPPDEPAAPLVIGRLKAVDTTDASSALDKRKTIIGAIVTIVVLVIIFVGLIPKFGSYADAWAEIQGMTPAALVAIGISVLVMLGVYVWPYQAAIPGLPYKPAFVIRQTSFMISNTIPAGGAFGLAIQFAMLSSYSVPVAAATAGIAVTSLWSLLMTLTLPVFGLVAALTTGQVQSQWVWVALAGIAATVATIVVLWLILRSEQSAHKVGELGNRMLAPVNRRRPNPIDAVGMAVDLRTSTKDVVFGRWRWVTVSNYLVILAQFAVLWFAIQGVLGDAPTSLTLAGAFAAFAISRMASMIPVTPGGLGTVDAALIALLTTFGLTNEQAVAATLVWRACSWVPQVCLGIVTFVYWRGAQARVGRAARAAQG